MRWTITTIILIITLLSISACGQLAGQAQLAVQEITNRTIKQNSPHLTYTHYEGLLATDITKQLQTQGAYNLCELSNRKVDSIFIYCDGFILGQVQYNKGKNNYILDQEENIIAKYSKEKLVDSVEYTFFDKEGNVILKLQTSKNPNNDFDQDKWDLLVLTATSNMLEAYGK